MKVERELLLKLGIINCTIRHLQIVTDFLNSGETDVKILLDSLGSWDENDLIIAEEFLKGV